MKRGNTVDPNKRWMAEFKLGRIVTYLYHRTEIELRQSVYEYEAAHCDVCFEEELCDD